VIEILNVLNLRTENMNTTCMLQVGPGRGLSLPQKAKRTNDTPSKLNSGLAGGYSRQILAEGFGGTDCVAAGKEPGSKGAWCRSVGEGAGG
jgi:hypothetical protein